MPALKHLHTYQQVKDRPNILRCIHPDCTHYAPKTLLAGKRALCPSCGNAFILTSQWLRLETPHCGDCTCKSRSEGARRGHLKRGNTLKVEEPTAKELEVLDISEEQIMANLDNVLKGRLT